MSVKIIIDSASDIDAEEAEKLGVVLIPMQIKFKDKEYADGVNLSHREFFEKLIESAELPKTSQINPFRFEEEFKRATADGSEVLAITISSKLSASFSSAREAAKKFGGKVRVVDSLNASLGERLLCLHALKLAHMGAGADEIAKELDGVKGNIRFIAVLSTLKYLKKGGRISALTAFTGEMLSIKPVVGVIGGEVKLVGKAVGSKRGNNLLNELVKKDGIDFGMPFGTVWSGLDDGTLKKYIEDSRAIWQDGTESVPEYMIGSTIGTHIGPGAIGVAFFSKNAGK